MVKEVGTSIGSVRAVAGRTVVAKTIPGRMLPTGEPKPGKLSAAPNLPLPGLMIAGPIWALKPGKPNNDPRLPGPCPNVPAEPPMNGKLTNGWLLNGRKIARPRSVPTFGPDGDRITAGPLQEVAPQRLLLGK